MKGLLAFSTNSRVGYRRSRVIACATRGENATEQLRL
ncbi:hypothetical protein AGR2A_Lc110019 [Agrobacterium genomosp. 2 str. CFBP 5494]|uniref:Uncharacterized protein n=1 Tax=Agrobacterium genomosp. 2 str. CFBP 5494 TaxID=1183436 RepID=A0A9W5B346_9HYPH|nr:hypothetical protein AGR2A_Lc110019 [Agrobacterium genomosp. 2 str. CFBP 5494]